jgi:hypothetical protein
LSSYKYDERSRNWSADKLRAHVLTIIDQVLLLARDTDPRKGSESERGKDLKAWKTLVHMREISETIAGWAIHHQAGLAINGLQHMNPASSAEMAENPEYKATLELLNSHANEAAGRACDDIELNSDTAQRILASCLAANPAGISQTLNGRLVSALRALEFGETLDLLKEVDVPYKKVRWEELQHQLRAVALIEYRFRRGFRKKEAQKEVAADFGVDEDAIRRWESSARKDLGNLVVINALDGARNAALLEDDAKRGASSLRPGYWDATYGADASKRDGLAYKDFKRAKKAKVMA